MRGPTSKPLRAAAFVMTRASAWECERRLRESIDGLVRPRVVAACLDDQQRRHPRRIALRRAVVDDAATQPRLRLERRRRGKDESAQPAGIDPQTGRVRADVRDRRAEVARRDRGHPGGRDELRPPDRLRRLPLSAEQNRGQPSLRAAGPVYVKSAPVRDLGPVHPGDLHDEGPSRRRVLVGRRARSEHQRGGRGDHPPHRASSSSRKPSAQRIHARACAIPQRSVA